MCANPTPACCSVSRAKNTSACASFDSAKFMSNDEPGDSKYRADMALGAWRRSYKREYWATIPNSPCLDVVSPYSTIQWLSYPQSRDQRITKKITQPK